MVEVELLEAGAGDDAELVARLVALVNAVYVVAEAGLWQEGAERTTPPGIAELIRAREIAVARQDGQAVGLIHVYAVADGVSGFGMLVSDPDRRGAGIGTALLEFAEAHGRELGSQAMQLELLVPREWSHASKEFLRGWYGRCGYRLARATTLEDDYPHLAPRLATPCCLEIHTKVL